jgi:hypothetical protein
VGPSSIPETITNTVLNCDSAKGAHPRPEFLRPGQVPELVFLLSHSAALLPKTGFLHSRNVSEKTQHSAAAPYGIPEKNL